MANAREIESDCRVQCNLILNDHDVDSKINVNKSTTRTSTYKVSENEDTSEVYINEQDYSNTEPDNEDDKGKDKDILDDRSEYNAESFCSDNSFKESETMNITPQSSRSDCSSLPRNANLKYDKETLEEVERRKNERLVLRLQEFDDCKDVSSLEDEIQYLTTNEIHSEQRQMRNGRKNMSFTNEQMKKIERENQILLRKIMSHQKPRNKTPVIESVQPRTSSSAINRKRLQKKIQEDNMMLLRRLQQTKSCATIRTTTPGYRLTFI